MKTQLTSIHKPNILHIDSERGWRGGQQQAAYLFEHLHLQGYMTMMACQPKSALHQYCLEKQLPCLPIRMRGEWDFIAGYRIAQFCKLNNINILHLHSAHALSTGIWVKLFYPQVRTIGVRRVDFPIQKNLLSQLKYSPRYMNRVVCISEGIRQVMINCGVPEDILVTIHSGVDLQKYTHIEKSPEFRNTWQIPEHHLIVGTVAALTWHKDYPNLLHAARKVIDHYPNVTFIAVGGGEDEAELKALAIKLNLGNHFIFAGFNKELGIFYNHFDMFVLSSVMEGLGTSILDAQAVGLPVIACRTGGIPEAVFDNENGLLVPPQNSEALANAILTLLCDEKKRHALGKHAQETVKSFSIEHTVQKNVRLYQEIG
ncbi:MAG: glycosyltransferase family 4 protein [Desulfobacterales bacterium]|nr:glycosyltransferase family 4 protein [Desulfobacterales bacterium]